MAAPFVDTKNVKKVLRYVEKGLSFQDIAKLMERDVKTIYRWYDYGIGRKKYLKRSKENIGKLSTR